MTAHPKYQASEDVIGREVAGEMVLLDLTSGLYFGLDPVGSLVWERLSQGPCSLAELGDAVEAEFDAPRDRIDADLVALFAQLTEKQLVSAV